tara:strand:- start:547 stop:780 length:234 start_codon:yes stop_codon:yes gene_type:complete
MRIRESSRLSGTLLSKKTTQWVQTTGTAAFVAMFHFFNAVKRTGVMASYPVGDRLTTGMSSAEPVQGCTLFGVSTEG